MIVADSGPLIAFARISRLDLLHSVLGEVFVPGAVYEELVIKGRGRPGAQEIEDSPWITRHTVERGPAAVSSRLHAGEVEAIALARRLGVQLLIDEHLGREAAREQGVDVVGSLTVLAEAKRLGLIEEAAPVLSQMMRSGYWLDTELMNAFLVAVGEPGESPA